MPIYACTCMHLVMQKHAACTHAVFVCILSRVCIHGRRDSRYGCMPCLFAYARICSCVHTLNMSLMVIAGTTVLVHTSSNQTEACTYQTTPSHNTTQEGRISRATERVIGKDRFGHVWAPRFEPPSTYVAVSMGPGKEIMCTQEVRCNRYPMYNREFALDVEVSTVLTCVWFGIRLLPCEQHRLCCHGISRWVGKHTYFARLLSRNSLDVALSKCCLVSCARTYT